MKQSTWITGWDVILEFNGAEVLELLDAGRKSKRLGNNGVRTLSYKCFTCSFTVSYQGPRDTQFTKVVERQ